jgi:hypothetical protein
MAKPVAVRLVYISTFFFFFCRLSCERWSSILHVLSVFHLHKAKYWSSSYMFCVDQ